MAQGRQDRCCGQKLLALGTALAVQLAQGRSAQELELLGALLEVVGDQLGLLALYAPGDTSSQRRGNGSSC